LVPNASADDESRVNIRKPRHVVVQILGATLQTAVIGVDVLDVVHAPCPLSLVLIESNMIDARSLTDGIITTVGIGAKDYILTEYR
jgi:hypothetical protein